MVVYVVYVLKDGSRVMEDNRRLFGEFAETLQFMIVKHGEVVDIQWD